MPGSPAVSTVLHDFSRHVVFLGEMQRFVFLPLPIVCCVCACVCVCACPSVFMPRWWTKGKWLEIKPFCSPSCSTRKKLFKDVFGDVVTHDLDLLFEGRIFESIPFQKSKCGYLANLSQHFFFNMFCHKMF